MEWHDGRLARLSDSTPVITCDILLCKDDNTVWRWNWQITVEKEEHLYVTIATKWLPSGTDNDNDDDDDDHYDDHDDDDDGGW